MKPKRSFHTLGPPKPIGDSTSALAANVDTFRAAETTRKFLVLDLGFFFCGIRNLTSRDIAGI